MAQFFGWYVSEGYCNGKNRVGISQIIPENRNKIDDLLKQLPWTYHWTKSAAIFTNEQLHKLVKEYGNSYNKYCPQWIKDSSKDILMKFLESAVDGAGWRQKDTEAYCSVSKRLAEDVAECWLKCGYSVSISEILPKPYTIRGRTGYNTVKQYHVYRGNLKWAMLRNSKQEPNYKVIDYNDRVYCATVPNGTLIIKRNNKISICGNCSIYCLVGFEAVRSICFDLQPVDNKPKSPKLEPIIKKSTELNEVMMDRQYKEVDQNNPWA